MNAAVDAANVHFAVARADAQTGNQFQRCSNGGDIRELRHGLFLLVNFVEAHEGFHE